MRVFFTKHICENYIKRINPNLDAITNVKERLIAAKKGIIPILEDANYLSDSRNGVLLYSKVFNCTLVLQHCRAITLYPGKKSFKKQEKALTVEGVKC